MLPSAFDACEMTPARQQKIDRTRLERAVGELLATTVRLTPLDDSNIRRDASEKLIIREANGRPERVVLCSSAEGPDLVARGMRIARELAAVLGPRMSRSVLLPLAEGRADGRSFAVVPFYTALGDAAPMRWTQNGYYGARVMVWLNDLATRTLRPVERLPRDVYAPLQAMRDRDGLSRELHHDVERAIRGLERGEWTPMHVACHGDMWRGNIMVDHRTLGGRRFGRFVIIDWPGAKVKGFPFYDLIRLAISCGVPDSLLMLAVLWQCRALRCLPEHARFHLIAALADLATRLEHWPAARYVEVANACHARLVGAGRGLRARGHLISPN
jgi:hypothetical protein